MAGIGAGFINHFRDGPEVLAGVTGSGTWPVGAGWGPLGGARASLERRGALGVGRSMVWVVGGFGSRGCLTAIVDHIHGFLRVGGGVG